MRLVHYKGTLRLEDGGDVRAALDLCGTLAGRGHEVPLLSYDPKDVPATWSDGAPDVPRSVPVSRLAGRLPRLGGADLRAAAECIRDADALHLHVVWDPVCAQLARVARRLGVPYVVSLHGMLDDWSMAQKTPKKRFFLTIGGRRMLEAADAVHCTAEEEREQSLKWYPRGRPVVIPYITDLAPYRELPGPDEARAAFPELFADPERPVVLYLSRLHPKKGLERLINAVDILHGRGVECTVAVAGVGEAGYTRELERLAAEVGVAERVRFLGFVGGTTKLSLYQAADLFVLPTSQENWGLVLTESLACGTPIVTTKGVDIWRELESSGAAVIADQTAVATADAIAGLLGDERLRAMGEKGRAWVLEHLDEERVASQYERLYAGLRPSARASG